MIPYVSKLALTIIFAGLIGCSGSESGGNLLGFQSDGSAGINGSLSGDIWRSDRGEKFNIESGSTINLSDDGDVYPSRNGNEYIEHIAEYETVEAEGRCVNSFNPYFALDLFNIRDTKTGAIKSSFTTPFRFYGPLKFSLDGQSIGGYSIDSDDCENNHITYFTLFNRNGEMISQFQSNTAVLYGFDWLPDNRLVVSFLR